MSSSTVNLQPPSSSSAGSRVKIVNVSKSFPGTRALDGVNLDIRAGEIHALIGGNGSGKSTLIKILCGVYKGDPGGVLELNGVSTRADESTPATARQSGVHVVHQDLGVFLDLTVAENLALGSQYERTWAHGISWKRLRARTATLIERFEINASPNTELRALGSAVRTQVAIARALQGDTSSSRGLLILDEPTASLPAHEVELLLSQLRRYASAGQAILYVSHRLDEIMAIADRVSALRDGKLVGTFDASDLTEESLIELIVGSQVERMAQSSLGPQRAERVFSARNIRTGPVRNATFHVDSGEILGIAGLLGSGRSELLRTAFGDLKALAGEMTLDGSRFLPRNISDAIKAGVAYIPEDRLQDAVFVDATITSNIAMPAVDSYFAGGRLRQSRMRRDATNDIGDFLIKAKNADDLLAQLSGGNQQKVVIARWLRLCPRLLLLDEPTQGVDVGARAEIYQLIRAATDGGAAAIVVASDFEELAAVCDRVLVIRDGHIVAELSGDDITPHRLTQITLKTSELAT